LGQKGARRDHKVAGGVEINPVIRNRGKGEKLRIGKGPPSPTIINRRGSGVGEGLGSAGGGFNCGGEKR